MQRGFIFYKPFLSLIILFSLSITSFAQSKKTVSKTPKTPAKQTCNGGWSGLVSFRKTLKKSLDYGKKKNIARGTTHNKHFRNYEYVGKLFVTASPNANVPYTKGRVAVKDRQTDWKRYEQIEDCSGDRVNNQQVQWSETENDSVKDAFGEDEAAEFHLTADELNGTYNFGFRFPEALGTETRVDKTVKGGWCTARLNEGNNDTRKNPVTVEGETFVFDDGKIDPKNPHTITGAKTWETGTTDTPGFRYEVSWSFKRCSPPLMITEIELFQPVHPSPDNWIKIAYGNYTIDGNQVKVVARIVNLSGAPRTAPVEFRELKENALLPEGKMSVTIEPNAEKEVVYMWDTSGYAWKESGDLNQSEINRRIEVKIPDDVKTENVEVRPKPVIVIPGMWTDKTAFSQFLSYFENQSAARWKVDYAKIVTSKSATENASVVAQKIKEIQETTNAWHVDLVGHSTGGLTGRVYINSLMGQLADGKPTVTNFVMVGTPNQGTPCSIGVDTIFSRFFNKSGDAFREITHKNMKEFNRRITAQNGTKFYALVGHGYNKTCQLETPGDGLVPAGSALWLSKDFIKNFKYTPTTSTHEFMLGETPNIKVIHQWLAVGPKGNHEPERADLTGNYEQSDEFSPKRRNYGASFANNFQTKDDEDIEPSFLTGVKLKPNQSTEIEIPVNEGKRMAINIMAPKNVSITLLDSNGAVVSQNLAGTPEAFKTFRTLDVNKPFQKGTWKLKLASRETEEAEIAVMVFIF